jgi:hypothetical protein
MKMMGGVCSTHKVMRNSCDIVVGWPKCKRPLERARNRWECDIKFILRKWKCKNVDWIELDALRVH